MSGLVGFINLDGAPIEPALLQKLTHSLAFRGPDGQSTWKQGAIGLGHARLCTTAESHREIQPSTLDGRVWITADCRIDGRPELIEQLKAEGRAVSTSTTDADLILHAYQAWGMSCLDHLLGDFSFAIWDEPRQRLFCARDHFGVKPFYYAYTKNCLAFSNTLETLRRHPSVSAKLNELAVADFLMFGENRDSRSTFFADISRLPPAHALVWSEGTFRLHRYWTLTADDEIHFSRPEDCIDRFQELFRTAVADRLRTDRAAVMMSGGLDSTAVAAAARDVSVDRRNPIDLRAFNYVYDRLIPDRERYYSDLAARSLNVPVEHLPSDDFALYGGFRKPDFPQPEPSYVAFPSILPAFFQQMAVHTRVALTGWDGDSLMRERPHYYFSALLQHRKLGRLTADVCRFIGHRRELPRIGVRLKLKRLLGMVPPDEQERFPAWIKPTLVADLKLHDRWRSFRQTWDAAALHPRRPCAMIGLTSRAWMGQFESYDLHASRFHIEVRHPLLDLRLVNFLLSVPPVPWCIDKHLLRSSLQGTLPDEVRLRPKSLLAGEPEQERLKEQQENWLRDFDFVPEVASFVDLNQLPPASGNGSSLEFSTTMRPYCLSHWLRHTRDLAS